MFLCAMNCSIASFFLSSRFNYNIPTDGIKKVNTLDHYAHCITDCTPYEEKDFIETCNTCTKKFMTGDLADHQSCDEQD